MKKREMRGSKRMMELGYKQSQIWMTVEQNKQICLAADQAGLTKTAFILQAALEAAKPLFSKIS
jgi:uncharacterized protein (DUF1778 family)